MMRDRLKWCCNQKHGIELVEPNKNLADAFILKAEHALEEMKNAKYKESRISFAYYTMYNAVYALLQRMGIKSEIHVCTFECMKKFLSEYFDETECSFIEKAHNARNDATYYVNKDIPNQFADEMMKKAPEMIAKCKSILTKLTEKKMNDVRTELKRFL